MTAVAKPRNPIRGILPVCCARAVTGQATAAPPRSCDELAPPHVPLPSSGQASVSAQATTLDRG